MKAANDRLHHAFIVYRLYAIDLMCSYGDCVQAVSDCALLAFINISVYTYIYIYIYIYIYCLFNLLNADCKLRKY